jgi:tetratricopeptide (TPR) repeat protein
MDNTRLPKSPLVHFLLIASVSLIIYSNTFTVPFHYDDFRFIRDNPFIKDFSYFLNPSKIYDINLPEDVHRYFRTRYVGFLSFWANYKLGGLNVKGYHLANIAIHIFNSVLVYLITILTFRTPFLRRSSINKKAPLIALFSGLLFVSHPLQTEAVTYILQRLALLSGMFYLLTTAAYIKGRLSEDNTSKYGFYILALASAVLGMKTKENVFSLPVAITLYEFLFFKATLKKRAIFLAPFLLTMLIVPLAYIDIYGAEDLGQATSLSSEISRHDYLLTQFRVIATYIRLLLFPINQNVDHDFPQYSKFFTSPVFLSFILLLCVIGLGVYLYRRSIKYDSAYRLAAFGIFWYFIALSVESSVLPIGELIVEYRCYLPSAGFFTACVILNVFVFDALKKRLVIFGRVLVPLLSLITLILAGAAYTRNIVWKKDLSLWEDSVSKSPNKARPNHNLGKAYEANDMIDKAIEHYQIALRSEPNTAKIHNNLGNAYRTKGMKRKAIECYERAISLKPDFAEPYINLGILYKTEGQWDKAISHYKHAISLNPDQPDAHYNIGNIYMMKGLTNSAVEHYRHSLSLRPEDPDVHNNLGIAYQQKGMLNEAEKEFSLAKRLQRAQ